jgi:toxin HigB-1
MIKSFRDKALAQFHATGETRGLKIVNAARVQRLLDILERARRPEALNVPGFGFHRLKGTRGNTYAVSISGNWRLTFKWDDEGAIDVNVEDYH